MQEFTVYRLWMMETLLIDYDYDDRFNETHLKQIKRNPDLREINRLYGIERPVIARSVSRNDAIAIADFSRAQYKPRIVPVRLDHLGSLMRFHCVTTGKDYLSEDDVCFNHCFNRYAFRRHLKDREKNPDIDGLVFRKLGEKI